jgi:hypothetical protein
MSNVVVKSSALICLRVNMTMKVGCRLFVGLKMNPKKVPVVRYVLINALQQVPKKRSNSVKKR